MDRRSFKMSWMSTRNRFTLYGALFGFLFPSLSSLAETWMRYDFISLSTILLVQKSSPLLWVIDSAPFFLGLISRIAGSKQESIERINSRLNKTNQRLKLENVRTNQMETVLQEMLSDYEKDLNSARIIQEFSLPEIPVFGECRFSYKYIPLNQVGGDLLSIVKLKEGGVSVLVGDVVGHGISAALITSLVKVLSNKNCKAYGVYPKQYMENLNKEVSYYLPEDYYLTALYAYLSFQEHSAKLNFSRAGHPHPLVYSTASKKTKTYEIQGTPLGVLGDLTYEELSLDLFSGDKVFMVTDGFLEVRNQEDKMLGVQGFSNIITVVCQKQLNLDETIDLIIQKTNDYSRDTASRDDKLILGIEIF